MHFFTTFCLSSASEFPITQRVICLMLSWSPLKLSFFKFVFLFYALIGWLSLLYLPDHLCVLCHLVCCSFFRVCVCVCVCVSVCMCCLFIAFFSSSWFFVIFSSSLLNSQCVHLFLSSLSIFMIIILNSLLDCLSPPHLYFFSEILSCSFIWNIFLTLPNSLHLFLHIQ